MQLDGVVAVSAAVRATRSRRAKIDAIAELLRRVDASELPVAVSYLAGQPRQGKVSVGWRTLRSVEPDPAPAPTLELLEVDRTLDALAAVGGAGAHARRDALLERLLGAATEDEQAFLRGLLLGELRQGALEGIVAQALARAWEIPEPVVRRALMLRADVGDVAAAAAEGGAAALRAVTLELFRPVQPMLAKTAASVDEALAALGEAAVEAKLDGVRVQAHRDGERVGVWSRTLKDMTGEVPSVVAFVAGLDAQRLVLDGELVALRPDGTPEAFQDTMRSMGDERARLVPYFFDVLHLDGEGLLDAPLRDRRAALERVVPAANRVDHVVAVDSQQAASAYDAALDAGFEGAVVKGLDGAYEAGRRGNAWRKVKPAHTLDLVVLAVEWGSGRRAGWLSNLHLGARSEDAGFVMLGKTFKGLTDATLEWQTERFLELETRREGHVVHVRPEQVVEIALDGLVRSPRYPAGIALRFARVIRYRDDKTATEADTVEGVRALLADRG